MRRPWSSLPQTMVHIWREVIKSPSSTLLEVGRRGGNALNPFSLSDRSLRRICHTSYVSVFPNPQPRLKTQDQVCQGTRGACTRAVSALQPWSAGRSRSVREPRSLRGPSGTWCRPLLSCWVSLRPRTMASAYCQSSTDKSNRRRNVVVPNQIDAVTCSHSVLVFSFDQSIQPSHDFVRWKGSWIQRFRMPTL